MTVRGLAEAARRGRLPADGQPAPSADWPDRAVVTVDLARVRAVIDRIAADLDELARARRVQDLNTRLFQSARAGDLEVIPGPAPAARR